MKLNQIFEDAQVEFKPRFPGDYEGSPMQTGKTDYPVPQSLQQIFQRTGVTFARNGQARAYSAAQIAALTAAIDQIKALAQGSTSGTTPAQMGPDYSSTQDTYQLPDGVVRISMSGPMGAPVLDWRGMKPGDSKY